MHTSHCIGHTVGSRTCCHVVRVKSTSCTTAGSNGEVFLASFDTLFFVGTCNWMLETSRVGGVSGDGNVNVLFPHDSNTFTNIVSAVAVNFRTRAVGVCFSVYFFQLAGVVVILGLYISKAVDTCDDLSSVFSKTVQDNTQRFLTYFVCFLSDTDSTLSSCEGLMSSQECEALGVLFQKHFAKVTMAKTNFTLICYRTRDTEGLKSLTDSCCSFRSFTTSFFDCDSCAYCVSPFCILEADWLNAFDHFVYVETSGFCNFCCFFDRVDSVLSELSQNLFLSSFI